MKNIFLLFTCVALLFVSCDGDAIDGEQGSVTLNFKADYNGQSLMLNENYNLNGDTILFTTFKYYVSNLSMGNQEFADILLIDAANDDNTYHYELPVGNYDNIEMGLGVDAIDNAKSPSIYANEHPLSFMQNNYWGMLNSYVFIKIEGFFIQNGVQTPIAYHVGSDPYYRNFSAAQNLQIVQNTNQTIDVVVDVNNVLQNVNLPTDADTHTVN
ncbi:MAG: MbnP family protein, partial [Chitinophagales bacterium]